MSFTVPGLKFGSLINNPMFALNISNKKVNDSDIKKQIDSIERILKETSDPVLFYKLGNFYKDITNYNKAIEYYNRFLRLNQPLYNIDSNALKNGIIGEIYYSLSEIDSYNNKNYNLEKALVYLTKAAELNPDNSSILLMLGDCCLSLGKTTEALYCYNKVLEKNDDILIYARLQAASFQGDYLKLLASQSEDEVKNQPITRNFNFDYLETAINNSSSDLKISFKIQHYVYLIRLMLVKYDFSSIKNQPDSPGFNRLFSEEEKLILSEAENAFNNRTLKISTIHT